MSPERAHTGPVVLSKYGNRLLDHPLSKVGSGQRAIGDSGDLPLTLQSVVSNDGSGYEPLMAGLEVAGPNFGHELQQEPRTARVVVVAFQTSQSIF